MLDQLLAAFTYDPIQRIGPVSPHGIGTALGFLFGAMLMARRAEPRGIPRQEVYNAVTWGAVGALIGARGFYVIGHLDQFDNIRDMLALWEGGLTMFGGFIGGLVLGLGYLKRNAFSVPTALEAAAPGFVVGVIVGRIGDLVIADHLGSPTTFPLGYQIPDAAIAPGYGPPTYVPGAIVHHPALYDLIGAVVLLVVIYRIEAVRPKAGLLFPTFAIWYGLQRLALDFTRNRELIETVVFGLSGSQWAGIAFAVGGAAAIARRRALGATPAQPSAPRDPPAASPSHEPASQPPPAAQERPPPPEQPPSQPSV